MTKQSYKLNWYYEPFRISKSYLVNGIYKHTLAPYTNLDKDIKYYFYEDQLQLIDLSYASDSILAYVKYTRIEIKIMSTDINFNTLEGLSFSVSMTQLPGVSLNLEISNFELPNQVDYWNHFIIEYAKNLSDSLLRQTTQIGLVISANGNFVSSNSDDVIQNISINSNWRVKLRRHSKSSY
jgi:hypothetical protein